jgi:hypothetical protein
MTFSEDSFHGQIDTSGPTWEYIKTCLHKIDPIHKSYFIMTDELSSYVQCAGDKTRLAIEYRKHTGETFKHYVVGNKKAKESLSISWARIDCKVGPIHIHANEVLTLDDAIIIFQAFYQKKDISLIYNLRNITRSFQK